MSVNHRYRMHGSKGAEAHGSAVHDSQHDLFCNVPAVVATVAGGGPVRSGDEFSQFADGSD
jgi:hypothetical protein